MVGDRYPVGIPAEVVEHILRATKWWFGVDDPMFSEQWPQPRGEDLWGSSKPESWFYFDDRIDGWWSKQFHPGFQETSLGQTPQKNPAKERSSTELRFASFPI